MHRLPPSIIIILFLVFSITFNPSCNLKPPTPAVTFSITFIEGDCFRINAQSTSSIRPSSTVASGDTLLCSYNGKLQVSFNDSDYAVLDRNTKAVILSPDSNHVTLMVLHGKVYSNVILLPKRGLYKTITPKIQTSVRGTAYTIEVDSGETAINVLEGTVAVTDNDSLCPIQVGQGERAVVNPGHFPCRIKSASLEELKTLVQWIGKSFINFRKITEYKNDLRFAAKLRTLDLIPQEPSEKILAAIPELGSRKVADAVSAAKPEEVRKPVFKQLAKSDMPEDSLRTPEYIREIIGGYRAPLQKLYNQEIRLAGPFKGRVIIRFLILPSGRVTKASVVSSSTGMVRFDSLLALRVSQLKFKPVRAQGEIAIVYPFDFTGEP